MQKIYKTLQHHTRQNRKINLLLRLKNGLLRWCTFCILYLEIIHVDTISQLLLKQKHAPQVFIPNCKGMLVPHQS